MLWLIVWIGVWSGISVFLHRKFEPTHSSGPASSLWWVDLVIAVLAGGLITLLLRFCYMFVIGIIL